MDVTKRYITKICRAAQRYANMSLQGTDLGASEYECLQNVRKNSGISQEKLRSILNIDKAAVTRMVANLEKKGYLFRLSDETDKRAKKLYVTDRVLKMKNRTSSMESFFYEWLIEDIEEEDRGIFLKVLDELYRKSKKERVEQFSNIKKRKLTGDVGNEDQPDSGTK